MPGVSIVGGKVEKLFSTPVITDELPGAEALNVELEQAIVGQMARDAGIQVSNRGGWHSQRDFIDWAGEAGGRLLKHALALADAHTVGRQQGAPPEWATDAWANVSESGHFNMPHVHGGTFWSAVYYVRCDGTGGELVLHDPRMPGLQMHAPGVRFRGLGAESEVAFTPKPGLMVLFPGWLAHSVEPWQGEGKRISVAMNIRAKS